MDEDTSTRKNISDILDANTSYMAYRKKIRELYPTLDLDFSSSPWSYAEAVYLFTHGLSERPTCGSCSKQVKYVDRTVGYRDYCSAKCSANSARVREQKIATAKLKPDPFNSEKRRKTMLDRYGVEHALQHHSFQDKARKKYNSRTDADRAETQRIRTETMLGRYGVENIWHLDTTKAKAAASNRERYGVDWAQQNKTILSKRVETVRRRGFDELANRFAGVKLLSPREDYRGINFYNGGAAYEWECLTCGHPFVSKVVNGEIDACPKCFPSEGASRGERELQEFFRNLGLNPGKDRTIIPPKELDFYLPDYGLAFEFNGMYWHSDDKVAPNYHLDKTLACRAAGIHLVHIFENEWLQRREIVESRIRSLCGKSHRIAARKCIVDTLTKSEAEHFLQTNHLQGSCVDKVRLGLRFDGNLVAVMTFGKGRFNRSADWELLRFANLLNTSVVGGASKLLATFDRDYGSPSVVSYSDRRWNSGSLYKTLGFKYSHSSSPSYWYFRNSELLNRMHFQKHKLSEILEDFNPNETEKDNMRRHGFRRIYDCGTDVFIRQ
jgi:rubrerythrin